MLLLGLVLAATASAAMLRSANHDKQKQLASVLGPEADATSPATKDLTMREGLGENLPYPSVDYLGEATFWQPCNPSCSWETQRPEPAGLAPTEAEPLGRRVSQSVPCTTAKLCRPSSVSHAPPLPPPPAHFPSPRPSNLCFARTGEAVQALDTT